MGLCDAVSLCLSGAYATFFLIAGVALAAYGAFSSYLILLTNSEQVVKNYLTVLPSAVTIVFGLVLVILVILGCCGICKESIYCVESYATFLIILAFSQLAFGGYCVITFGNTDYTTNLDIQIRNDIKNAVANYRQNPETMDAIQIWMQCCGYMNPISEYNFYVGQLPGNSELPLSCCGKAAVTCTYDSKQLNSYGCSSKVAQFTSVTNYLMGWISLVIGATELIAALLGICLSCCIWRNQMGSWR